MKIEQLELTNFRSYGWAEFELHPAITLVVGPNASGKTNLLEALYVLAVTKSFRARDRDLVRHEQDHFRIVASGEQELALGFSTAGGLSQKRVTHDGAAKTLGSHLGQLQIVLFEPTDLDLVSGTPENRRRYLDFILCQTDHDYLRTLQRYRRVLKQRNALLEIEDRIQIEREIFAWNVQLTELAAAIFDRRQELLAALNEVVPGVYADIAGEPVATKLSYVPTVEGQNYGDAFMAALDRNLRRDMAAGFTTIGPHREDFEVKFNDNQIESVASRGEVRTVVLALKLAELIYNEKQTGIRPLLLLDDVFSELDSDRRGFLMHRLTDYQSLITTTDADAVTRELTTPHKIIHTGAAA